MPDYALMNQYLYEGNAKEVEQMTRDALAEGRAVQEILTDGLIAGMSVVGEDFKHNILYVPEVLIAARAMKAGMNVLKPLLSAKDSTTKRIGTLLMGTVRGDLDDHDELEAVNVKVTENAQAHPASAPTSTLSDDLMKTLMSSPHPAAAPAAS